MLNKLFNMHNKLILNKLFICLINYELISYVKYFLLKKYLKISSLIAFNVTLMCEAATNSWKLNRKWTP